jgi:arylsulfatase A-like enzyme
MRTPAPPPIDRRRRDVLRALGAVAALPALAQAQRLGPQDRARMPNVVMFLTDDQRFDALSAAGNRILHTPNMDRIGREGIRFEQAFVTCSLCAPSRASFLTGLYPHTHGVVSNGDGPQYEGGPGIRDDQLTFVDRLHAGGWHTGLVGKWHLPSRPRGFDDWVIFPWQGEYHDPQMLANGVPLQLRGHADDVVGDQALAYLRARPTDRPFCLLVQFKSPHRNWQPAARYANAFADVDIPLPDTLLDKLAGKPDAVKRAEMALADMPDYRERVPASLPAAERARRNLQLMVRDYYRVLLSVDDSVGRVLDQLDADNLAEQTVVIYASDNGFFLGEHGLFDKRLMYEPSIRIPLMLRYPAQVPAGVVDTTHMVLNIDVAPTVLDLCGAGSDPQMQGRSLYPLLRGHDSPWREDFLYEYFEYPAGHCARKNRGLRTTRWKLIEFYEQPQEWELYDLQADPGENHNLIDDAAHAATLATLRARLVEVRRDLGDVDPPGPAPMAAGCHDGARVPAEG